VADNLIDTLMTHEDRYQDVTIQLMLEVASMTTFPNLEQIKEPSERAERIAIAEKAVARLHAVTKAFSSRLKEQEKQDAMRKAAAAQAAAQRKFADDLSDLKDRFLVLQKESDRQQRGYAFESLLADLFLLFDLEPRLSYVVDTDQIDGAFTYDTDDYILEARWRQQPSSRGDGDVFNAKVQRRGKNALGLFVSIAGLSGDFRTTFARETTFITMDGQDLYLVLDDRIRLDDALRIKKRHANETGSCFLQLSSVIGT